MGDVGKWRPRGSRADLMEFESPHPHVLRFEHGIWVLFVMIWVIPLGACIAAVFDWAREQRWDDEDRGQDRDVTVAPIVDLGGPHPDDPDDDVGA